MNQLKVDQRETILRLKERGWSGRQIARELGYNRETISKYLRSAKPATLTPGSEGDGGAKPVTPTAGSGADGGEGAAGAEAVAVVAAIDAAKANVSLCEGWKAEIEAGLAKGYSAKRIHEDLVREWRFAGSYQSVKRYVRRLEQEASVPFRRMDFAPGEQLQVDFGTGARIINPEIPIESAGLNELA